MCIRDRQNTLSVPRGGEFRLTLSDGTRVHLNSLSELKYPVSFKGMNERTVELKGEAFFEIAKDSLHPFKVETQGILIQQFGTAFNVKSQMCIRDRGTIALASHQVMLAISQFTFMMYYGMGAAVAVRVSNFKGQNDIINVRRSAYAGFHLMMTLGVVLSLIVFLCRNYLGGWFTDSQEVAAMAVSYTHL